MEHAICYGRSVVTIGEQLYGTDDTISAEEKTKKAQGVYDAVLAAFPNLRKLMINTQAMAKKYGYTETILGRRRHIPDMQLPEFEFKPMKGYVNPDIDPMDVTTLNKGSDIPDRIVQQLEKEFKSYKYFGQIAKRTKELAEQHIRVINNRSKITDASRKCVNSVVQGSAAEMTKLALLNIFSSAEWGAIGGRVLVPVHDEIIVEVPECNYEEGSKLLSKMMSDAGNFLPFPINCDVETWHRWYGMDVPCPYTEPITHDLDKMSSDEIKWIQYHIIECEYTLPIFNDENGDKPRGDAARGVNGIITDELKSAIADYCHRYKLSEDDFLSHIKRKVQEGTI